MMRSIFTLIFNIIWLLTAGWSLFLAYLVFGVMACLLIVTIPFGVASFKIAGFVLWPFGREVVERQQVSGLSTLANVLWFLVAGLWLAIAHILTAIAQAVTIIGIPLAWANIKLIPITCFPFGKEIVSSSDERAKMVPTAR